MDDKEDFFKDVEQREPSFEEDAAFFEKEEEKHRKFFEKEDKVGGDPTFFSAFSMSRADVIEEVKKDGMFLSRVSGKFGDDFEVVSYAVENNGNALAFASKRIQADNEATRFFVDAKKNQIALAQQDKQDNAVIAALQQEIETINLVHSQAQKAQTKTNGLRQFM